MLVNILRVGNLLLIGNTEDKNEVIPSSVRFDLESKLTYYKKQLEVGYRSRRKYGKPFHTYSIKKRLYTYDSKGRMVCGSGLLEKVVKVISDLGYHPVVSVSKNSKNEDIYKEDWDSVKKLFDLRPAQESFLRALSSHRCGTAEAPPGFGKSTLISALCLLFPLAKIAVVVKRRELAVKLYETLSDYMTGVGIIGAGHKVKGDRINIYTAASLHHSDKDEDIVIGDEVHELMADSYAAQLSKFKDARMYGISATLRGRSDGTDARLEAIFGPTRFKLSYGEAVRLGLVVPIIVEWVDVSVAVDSKDKIDDLVSFNRWNIWRNWIRNKIIADTARRFGDDVQVLIIVQTMEHAVYLKSILNEYEIMYANDATTNEEIEKYIRQGLLPKGYEPLTRAKRLKMRSDFESGKLKKVISTYVWDTGVDFKSLSVVIRADGVSSQIKDVQTPGRVCRVCRETNKEYGLVIDFMDRFSTRLMKKARKRMISYSRLGWRQIGCIKNEEKKDRSVFVFGSETKIFKNRGDEGNDQENLLRN